MSAGAVNQNMKYQVNNTQGSDVQASYDTIRKLYEAKQLEEKAKKEQLNEQEKQKMQVFAAETEQLGRLITFYEYLPNTIVSSQNYIPLTDLQTLLEYSGMTAPTEYNMRLVTESLKNKSFVYSAVEDTLKNGSKNEKKALQKAINDNNLGEIINIVGLGAGIMNTLSKEKASYTGLIWNRIVDHRQDIMKNIYENNEVSDEAYYMIKIMYGMYARDYGKDGVGKANSMLEQINNKVDEIYKKRYNLLLEQQQAITQMETYGH